MESVRVLLNLLLIGLIAGVAANITWQLFAVVANDSPVVALVQTEHPDLKRTQPSRPRAASVTDYPDLHLFGKADRGEIVEEEDQPIEAPRTSLSLILKGVISSSSSDRALAIIAEKNNAQEDDVYGVGDRVPGNALISKIYADRVILLRAGRNEALLLAADVPAAGAIKRVSHDYGNIRSKGDGRNFTISGKYLNERLRDIPSLAREIGVEIYREGDIQKGYKLISARGSKLLTDLGLQPGDILQEVNGVPLTSIHNGLVAYQRLKDAPEIRIVISRNGRRESRVYPIDK